MCCGWKQSVLRRNYRQERQSRGRSGGRYLEERYEHRIQFTRKEGVAGDFRCERTNGLRKTVDAEPESASPCTFVHNTASLGTLTAHHNLPF